MKRKPRILITAGDPKGIGPEVTKKALRDSSIKDIASFLVIEARDKTGLEALKEAVNILKKGAADGLVTAPLNKSAINKSGVFFKGHTEYLARITHTKKIAMMFCAQPFKVTVVTRHLALKKVPQVLTQRGIEDAIWLTHRALKEHFNIPTPRIGVCGLNPHAGEDGLIGFEEKNIIVPAIRRARTKKIHAVGPLPADVIFYMAYKGKFDAVIAMYHDQGLGPFKMIGFEDGVNVTLGLPFVRTSPDHGTAYDIAGKGIANPLSMKEAIKLAVKMCSR